MTERDQNKPDRAESKAPLVLIVSTKFDPHVDIIIDQLRSKGTQFVRFNTEDFPLHSDIITYLDKDQTDQKMNFPQAQNIDGSDITSVWYRRPADPEFPDCFTEAEKEFAQKETKAMLRGIWSSLDCLWVNDPEKNRVANVKLSQLRLATRLGLKIPKTLMTNNPDRARDFFFECNKQMIIKPYESGLVGKGDDAEAIYTSVVKESDIENIESTRHTPVLLQEYVPKKKELRITIVGSEVFSAEIDSQATAGTSIDWRRNPYGVSYKARQLPDRIRGKCVEILKSYGLNFGAIDMILTPSDEYVFLEINPNGQWAWIEDLTAMPIASTLSDFLAGKKT